MNNRYVFRTPTEPERQKISRIYMKGFKTEKRIMIISFIIVCIFTLCFLAGLFENIRTGSGLIKSLPIFAISVTALGFTIILFKGMLSKIRIVSDIDNGDFGIMDCICTDVQMISTKKDTVCPAARVYPLETPECVSEKIYPVYTCSFKQSQELENRVAWLVRIERCDKEYLCIR